MTFLRFKIIYDRKHATKSGKQGTIEVRFCMNTCILARWDWLLYTTTTSLLNFSSTMQ